MSGPDLTEETNGATKSGTRNCFVGSCAGSRDCALFTPASARNRRAVWPVDCLLRPFMCAFADELVAQVEEGIRVLRIRDGVVLSEAQIHERAANIVTGLMGLYDLRPLASAPAPKSGPFAFARWAQLRHLFHRPMPAARQFAGRHR